MKFLGVISLPDMPFAGRPFTVTMASGSDHAVSQLLLKTGCGAMQGGGRDVGIAELFEQMRT